MGTQCLCNVAGDDQINIIYSEKVVDLLNIKNRSSGTVRMFRILMLKINIFDNVFFLPSDG